MFYIRKVGLCIGIGYGYGGKYGGVNGGQKILGSVVLCFVYPLFCLILWILSLNASKDHIY